MASNMGTTIESRRKVRQSRSFDVVMAYNWLTNNAQINHRLGELLTERKVTRQARSDTLHKAWGAHVYQPLCAHIRKRRAQNTEELRQTCMKVYEVYLKYCNDPYAVLSLDTATDKYDPFVVVRGRDFVVRCETLQDPLDLAGREKKLESIILQPDWPVHHRH